MELTLDELAKLKEMVHVEREACIAAFDLPKFGWENKTSLKTGVEGHVLFLMTLEHKLDDEMKNQKSVGVLRAA